MPYDVRMLLIGHGRPVTTPSALMPRADFIEAVEEELYSGDYSDSVRDKVLPVAKTMPRFPLGTWLHSTRGCGCIVGEYLVAADIIDRLASIRAAAICSSDGPVDVHTTLYRLPDGAALRTFGTAIDQRLSAMVDGLAVDGQRVVSIELVD